jgi:hypothetical protein
MLQPKVMTQGASDLFDAAALDALREIFGDRTAMLLSRTRQMVVERMGMMAEVEGPDRGERLARIAHEVGGMAGQVGMTRLSREALAMERLCREGDAAAVDRAVDALDALARDSLAALPAA